MVEKDPSYLMMSLVMFLDYLLGFVTVAEPSIYCSVCLYFIAIYASFKFFPGQFKTIVLGSYYFLEYFCVCVWIYYSFLGSFSNKPLVFPHLIFYFIFSVFQLFLSCFF